MTNQYIIAAVRDSKMLSAAINSPVSHVFLLCGSICELSEHCSLLRDAGKKVFLHLDLLEGLRSDHSGIRFIAEQCSPDGVISTKGQCLKIAKSYGLKTILRCFVIDSLVLKTASQQIKQAKPDYIEVLPGISAKIIRLALMQFKLPIIAGGLISEEQDIKNAFEAGATAVSTSRPELWNRKQ